MITIAKATHRVRNTKGSCYLTHGDDNYDHRGLNKARRRLDQAVIAEWADEPVTAEPAKSGTTTFRLVLWTQIYENYGAHCWDGTGECPQYWKAKGGTEYHYQLGDANAVLALGAKGLEALVKQLTGKINKWDNSWDEYVIGWQVWPSTEKTQDEEWELPVRKLN
jgi:hypothetical protein